MKLKSNRIFAAVLSLCLFLNLTAITGFASTYASYYYSYTEVHASAVGNGKVLFEFDVDATDFMDELGAERIIVREEQPDGSYSAVYTFTRYNTGGFIAYGVDSHGCGVVYQGTPGVKYYATVQFYAKNENGNESIYQNTRKVTA